MSRLDLPRSMRDPGFRRRFDALARATTEAERNEVLAEPLVADRVYDPEAQVECPAGHVDMHAAERHSYAGMTFVARSCARCPNGWWERVEL